MSVGGARKGASFRGAQVLDPATIAAMSTPDAPEPKWLDAQEQAAWRAYLRGSRELEVALERDLTEHGVSLPEYELLSMLSEADGGRSRMSTLADFIVQSRSRVTHTASRLEKRGWCMRAPAPDDGRGVVLCLTEAGREIIRELAMIHVASVRRHLIDVLSREQLLALGNAMQAVRDANSSEGAEETDAR